MLQQGSGGCEQPVEGPPDLLGAVLGGQITIHVLQGGLEHVQRIAKTVELAPGDNELRLAEAQVTGSPACFVVPLPA